LTVAVPESGVFLAISPSTVQNESVNFARPAKSREDAMARYYVKISEGTQDTFGLRSRCEEFLRNHAAPEKLNGEDAAEDLQRRFRKAVEEAFQKNLEAIEIASHEYPEGIEFRFVGGPAGGNVISSKTPGAEWIREAFRLTGEGKEGNRFALDVTGPHKNGPERAQYEIEHKHTMQNGDAVVLYCRFVHSE
jgi:hypothetical protein